jgi:hypothetical protein
MKPSILGIGFNKAFTDNIALVIRRLKNVEHLQE